MGYSLRGVWVVWFFGGKGLVRSPPDRGLLKAKALTCMVQLQMLENFVAINLVGWKVATVGT